MSRRVLAMLIVGVAALAMFAVGCGGGSDEEPLTKAEYIKQSDKICEGTAKEITVGYKAFAKEKGIKKGNFPNKKQGYEIAEDIYLPAYETEAEKRRELVPPTKDEDQADAILTASEESVEKAYDDLGVLFGEGKDPFEKTRKLSKAYGFKVCGN